MFPVKGKGKKKSSPTRLSHNVGLQWARLGEPSRARLEERRCKKKRRAEVGQDRVYKFGYSFVFFFLFSLTCSRCDSGDEVLPLQGFKEAKIPCRKSIAKALPEDRIRVNILKEKKKVKI